MGCEVGPADSQIGKELLPGVLSDGEAFARNQHRRGSPSAGILVDAELDLTLSRSAAAVLNPYPADRARRRPRAPIRGLTSTLTSSDQALASKCVGLSVYRQFPGGGCGGEGGPDAAA